MSRVARGAWLVLEDICPRRIDRGLREAAAREGSRVARRQTSNKGNSDDGGRAVTSILHDAPKAAEMAGVAAPVCGLVVVEENRFFSHGKTCSPRRVLVCCLAESDMFWDGAASTKLKSLSLTVSSAGT